MCVTLTMIENSPNIFEQSSARRVPIYNFLFPIILGITTSPGRLFPMFKLVFPSPSSNTKHLWAKGNTEPGGRSSVIEPTNWEYMEESTSVWVQLAIPITPRGKSDGRNKFKIER